ncbi:hypothetical protein [Hymenobacter volaticus]|uniref:Uncharacterized protein n=1 Tax=Hymenobacter volaticus TaxID=2932254 RepID=A0ABY4G949_9BACT|nr:hypothetical protein [Hymenobacter volaticus]UOQ67408.1 hypothetical protein MUN86_05880 [Hymenobacter volaticus]
MATSSMVGVLLVAAVAFMSISPEFGGKPTKADKQVYAKSGHYQDGEFVNLVPTVELTGAAW